METKLQLRYFALLGVGPHDSFFSYVIYLPTCGFYMCLESQVDKGRYLDLKLRLLPICFILLKKVFNLLVDLRERKKAK